MGEQPDSRADWSDRSGMLRAMGFALLLFGGAFGFAGPFVITAGSGSGIGAVIAAMFQTLPLTATLLICGVGLWRLRRWARQATIAVSFVFLAKGVLQSMQFLQQLPLMIEQVARSEQPPPPSEIEAVQGMSVAFAAVVFLFFPALYLWIISGRNAAKTFARYQPKPSRLDLIPGPLLALAFLFLWEGAGLIGMLWYNATVPVLGRILSGPPGAAALLCGAIACAACARGLYLRDRRAWKAAIGLVAFSCISWAIIYNTESGAGFYQELYRTMGFEPAEIGMFIKTGSGPWNARWSLAGSVAVLAFSLYCGRFFNDPPCGLEED